MHRYLPELATRSVPRYTSYPTAAEFKPILDQATQARALGSLPADSPASLYVHVPYCHQICWYCGCNTGAVGRGDRLAAYVEALLAEIALVAEQVAAPVASIHFGGGSPNSFDAAQFVRLVDSIETHFRSTSDLEIAVEIDPRHLSRSFVAALEARRVRRASIGVQTFSVAVQRRINRVQPFDLVRRAMDRLRAAGVSGINFDLLYGLPDQTEADVQDTIARTIELSPDRIAMFGYAHVPGLLPRQRMIDATSLPGPEQRFRQSMLAHDLLVAHGYQAIGFDHFARPGDPLARAAREGRLRRNFQGFSDEPSKSVIGLGASAISQFDALLVQNEKHVGRYRLLTGNGRLAGVRGVARTREDQLRGRVIERLLCDGVADVHTIAAELGFAPATLAGSIHRLAHLAGSGLIAVEGWRCTILEPGRPYARLIASAFDSYRCEEPTRFSHAV